MPRTGFAMVSILSNPQLARPLAIASPASLHQEGLAFWKVSPSPLLLLSLSLYRHPNLR
jgi:hypothetical protein